MKKKVAKKVVYQLKYKDFVGRSFVRNTKHFASLKSWTKLKNSPMLTVCKLLKL